MSEERENIRRKIEALLAKAESTQFPDEAEALSAKAAELMEKHAIAVHLDGSRRQSADDVDKVEFNVSGSYHIALRDFVAHVGYGLGFHVTIRGKETMYWHGFKDDLELAEKLYLSLRLQCERFMRAYMLTYVPQNKIDDRSEKYYERRSFIQGFGVRAGQRLKEARTRGQEEAVTEYGNSAALAIRDRASLIEEWAKKQGFRQARTNKTKITASGFYAGNDAADRADIGQGALHR